MSIENFDQVTIAPAKLRPFSKFIMSIGELPTSYLDSLSYAEQVTWFCDYLQNQVIPALNNNATALEEVQNLMTELQEYVDNYFETGFPELVSNKLDEMAEDGTLESLIASFINDKFSRWYSTVNDMKEDTSLIDGMYAVVLGYYEANDGGYAKYIISDDDLTPNNGSIIELSNGNYAVLCSDEINIKMFGAKGNGSDDDTQAIQNAINYTQNNKNLYFLNGTYIISQLIINTNNTCLIGKNKSKVILKSKSSNSNDSIIKIENNGVMYSKINNITIDGNKSNNSNSIDGIKITTSSYNGDCYLEISDMIIRNLTKNGIYINGNSSLGVREMRLINNIISRCDENGLELNNATDCFFNLNTSYLNLKAGYVFNDGANKIVENKAFLNGKGDETTIDLSRTPASAFTLTADETPITGKDYYTRSGKGTFNSPYKFTKVTISAFTPDVNYYELSKSYYKRYAGFIINGAKNIISDCEAQENYGDGFLVLKQNNIFETCIADNNGFLSINGTTTSYTNTGLTQIYDGFHLIDADYTRITATGYNFRYNAYGSMQRSTIGIISSENVNFDIISALQVTDVTNEETYKIKGVVNGYNYQIIYDLSQIQTYGNYTIHSNSFMKKIGNRVYAFLVMENTTDKISQVYDPGTYTIKLPSGFIPNKNFMTTGMVSGNHGNAWNGLCSVQLLTNGDIMYRGNDTYDTARTSVCIYVDYETY